MPWRSSGYDARPECKRPGFDSPLRHWIFRWNPLLHLAPNYGIHWSICMVKAWGHAFLRGGWMWWQTEQMPWRSSGYDARPECKRPGFDSPLRHWIFRWNPLLHLAPNYGIHWSICMVKAWGHAFLRGGWMWWQTEQMPWRSSGYDAHPECERPGFGSPLRHWIFRRNPLLHLNEFV